MSIAIRRAAIVAGLITLALVLAAAVTSIVVLLVTISLSAAFI